ncbi:uncharacterized protein KD926_002080 [Aspergillus affinis]|uniref:uncharacterized protein n=1 Tax=Aspergillus affinis TaxID=1070780 RepID=UPI0022FE6837|nr:uncharacterized protein KD926_002080 [Aspergillus affinis]KAI9036316.1 hypothetical protein KD926_002080 [Aspergillus affinis]
MTEREVSPSRPGTPSSFECHVTLEGGRSSAMDLLPSNLRRSKKEHLYETEEYQRAIFDASFLRAENAWLRKIRKSALVLQEETLHPSIDILSKGTKSIHDSLTRFYIAFGAIEQTIRFLQQPVLADVEATLQELTLAFEICREGLEEVRHATKIVETGQNSFTLQTLRSNRSYESFFGISYDETTPASWFNWSDSARVKS